MTAPARRTHGLRRHLVLTALVGAAVVAAVTAALALPLVRSVAREQARVDLARAVDSLAAAPRATSQALVKERRAIGPGDREYAVVGADGSVSGEAAPFLTADQVARLRSTGTLTATVHSGGTDLLVEGRQVGRRQISVVGVQSVDAIQQATDRLVRRILVGLGAGLAIATALGLLIARLVTRPVQDAADRAHRLASGERGLDQQPSSITEIQEMVTALGVLDRALAASEDRQREFLLSISHELRTPLTALHGYAEALRDGAVAPDGVAAVGTVLTTESERLGRFIDDLLALARLEADDFTVVEAVLDLRPVVEDATAAWQAVAAANQVRLAVEPGDPVPARTDGARVQQVVAGLVENALRVTPSGGTVTVRLVTGPTGPEVTVTDDGPGLAPGDHERAFERGYLRDRYAGDRAVGSGLGLSIAARICERLGGTVTAGPATPQGTVMRVVLPEVPGVTPTRDRA